MRGTFHGSGRSRILDLSEVKTYDSRERINLVTIDNLMTPGVTPHEKYEHPDFDILISRIVEARKNGRPVIWSMGAHVIKNRLSRYILELIKEGVITHIASNGAGSIHDFELAYLGGTSEDVPTAIEDGSFGMWEQTGAWMNEAIKAGAKEGLGYGEALGCEVFFSREPHEVRKRLAEAEITLSERLHGAILSQLSSTPFILRKESLKCRRFTDEVGRVAASLGTRSPSLSGVFELGDFKARGGCDFDRINSVFARSLGRALGQAMSDFLRQ